MKALLIVWILSKGQLVPDFRGLYSSLEACEAAGEAAVESELAKQARKGPVAGSGYVCEHD